MDSWDIKNTRNITFGEVYRLCDACSINPGTQKQWCIDCEEDHIYCPTCFNRYDEGFAKNEYHPDIIEDMR